MPLKRIVCANVIGSHFNFWFYWDETSSGDVSSNEVERVILTNNLSRFSYICEAISLMQSVRLYR